MKISNKLQEAVQERLKCSDLETGLNYFLSNYVKLTETGTGKLIPFKPWPIQKEKYIDTWVDLWKKQREAIKAGTTPEKNGIIFMASRQCGKTQLTEALCTWLLLFFPSYQILHLNKDQQTAKNIIQEIHAMIDNLPSFLKPKFKQDTKDRGFMLDNNARLMIEASKSTTKRGDSAKGRSLRPNLVWIDEAAFVDLGEHLSAIIPATSRSFITSLQNEIPYGMIFTSTPNGRTGVGERFYREWMACQAGDPTNLIAVSYLWKQCPGYDEEWYKTACASEHCTPERPTAKVNQEYNLMFISNNRSLFDDDVMEKLQNPDKATSPILRTTFPNGYIDWFENPKKDTGYIVGIDTATMDGTDSSAIEVIDQKTNKQVCEGKFKCQVKEFCNKYIPMVVDKLEDKLIVIEKNGVGNQTLEMLEEKYPMQLYGDYTDIYNPKYGIASTAQTRKMCVEQIFNMCSYHETDLRSYNLRIEATSLERKSNGRIEGNPHDDMCFAMGWARYVNEHETPFVMKYFRNKRYSQKADEVISDFVNVNAGVESSKEETRRFEEMTNKIAATTGSNINVATMKELKDMFEADRAIRQSKYDSSDDDIFLFT